MLCELKLKGKVLVDSKFDVGDVGEVDRKKWFWGWKNENRARKENASLHPDLAALF